MLELVPSEEEQAWRSRFAVLPDMEVYRSILATTLRERRWKRFSFNPFTNHLAWERFRGDLADALGRMRVRERPATLDDVREEIELIRAYIGVHLCSLLFAHLFYQLLDASLSVWLPQSAPALMDALARCPPGNLTLATNRALAELAEQLDDSDLAAMAAGTPLPEPAASELARFLARYGHRSEASWEIFSPRWGADPASLIALLRVARTSADPEDEGAVERAAGAAMAEVRGALGPVQHAFVGMLVHYTRRYLLLRENQRFWFDQLLWRTQRSLQDVGASLVEQGTLADAADVSMLTWSELVDAVKGGGPSMATRVAKRRATWQRQRSGPRPAVFFSGDTVEAPLVDAQKLSGLAISPGRARGRVRVLETLEAGAELEPGEVIVAHAVDPGWTPLFGLASAVVLEMGSVLSHGAVVAREYRLPAVVNIDRVTARLRTGDDVTVDGTRGVVWVHR
jgi:pyruvate,water dikinase